MQILIPFTFIYLLSTSILRDRLIPICTRYTYLYTYPYYLLTCLLSGDLNILPITYSYIYKLGTPIMQQLECPIYLHIYVHIYYIIITSLFVSKQNKQEEGIKICAPRIFTNMYIYMYVYIGQEGRRSGMQKKYVLLRAVNCVVQWRGLTQSARLLVFLELGQRCTLRGPHILL